MYEKKHNWPTSHKKSYLAKKRGHVTSHSITGHRSHLIQSQRSCHRILTVHKSPTCIQSRYTCGQKTTCKPFSAWFKLKHNSGDETISLTKCETVHLAQQTNPSAKRFTGSSLKDTSTVLSDHMNINFPIRTLLFF